MSYCDMLGPRGMPLYRVRDKNVVSEIIDDEAIIMDLADGTYFSSDGAGAIIWDGIICGFEAAQIKERLHHGFSVDPAVLNADFDRFVATLCGHKLVEIAHDAACSSMEWNMALPATKRAYGPPTLNRYDDLQKLALLDPIHDVEEAGWPNRKTDF
ncbi:MAG TPA: PqqD family protein [Phototrophicaceae bacterium]|nr:PqqD family protein [Phototrophicaceae bacterium]